MNSRPKISAFIAISLDGYIARAQGELDWLEQANARIPPSEDCGYLAFMQDIDVLVMGRRTYEKVLTFGAWPYGGKQVIVMSSQPIMFGGGIPPSVECSSEAPQVLVDRLTAKGVRHLYVDGGNTIQRFLAAGLIDDITLTLIPVLLGSGIPLFASSAQTVELELLDSKAWDFGLVQNKYRVLKS